MSTPISGTDTATALDVGTALAPATDGDTATASDVAVAQLGTQNDDANALDHAIAFYVTGVTWLVAPLNGQVVYSATPVLSFAVKRVSFDAPTTAQLELQVSTTPDFSSGVQFTDVFTTNTDGRTATTIRISTALADGTYYWRVRDTGSGVFDWTPTASFVISATAVSSTAVAGQWNCVPGTSALQPALWFIHPSRARAGDSVTLFGAGLGDGHGSSATDITGPDPTSVWSLVAADGNAYTSARVLDQLTREISAEHSEIAITVPSDFSATGDARPIGVSVDTTPMGPPFATPKFWWVGDDYTTGSSWPSRGSVSAPLVLSGGGSIPTGVTLNGHRGIDLTTVNLNAAFLGTQDFTAGLHVFAVVRPVGGASPGGAANDVWSLSSSSFTAELALNLSTDGSNVSTVTLLASDPTFFDGESYTAPSSIQNTPLALEWTFPPTVLRVAGSSVSTVPDSADNTGTPEGVTVTGASVGMSTAPVVVYEVLVFSTVSPTDVTAVRSYLATTYGITT